MHYSKKSPYKRLHSYAIYISKILSITKNFKDILSK